MYYVYLLRSQKSGTFYVGFTANLERRVAEHNDNGVTATHGKGPWQLVYYEAYMVESQAREREAKLKQYGSSYHGLIKRLKFAK